MSRLLKPIWFMVGMLLSLVTTPSYAATGTLVLPVNNAAYTAPATILLSVSASAPTGSTVTKVEFYVNGSLLGTLTQSPYNANWTNVAAGTYTISAKVFDSAGGWRLPILPLPKCMQRIPLTRLLQ